MFGIYLHIPFCSSKCPYCDFFSVIGDEHTLADYCRLLQRELEVHAPHWQGPCDSLFLGGGTPSLLKPDQIRILLQTIRELYSLSPEAEITLEANPGDLSFETLHDYRTAGINRLSLGVQSFDERQLASIGRRHTGEQARSAFHSTRQAGFDNISCDLIFALPGQTADDLEQDIDTLLELAPQHISCYALTLEEGTPLHRQHQLNPLPLPDDEQSAELYLQLHEKLCAAGYEHYEISNYALPGYACRHNQSTWRRQPYLGVGAGAHSFLAKGWGERRANPSDLENYRLALARGLQPSERLEQFDRTAAMSETLYLALRTSQGVDAQLFRQLFGVNLEETFSNAADRCGSYLVRDVHGWRFTPSGWLLFDHLIQHFLP